MAGCRCVSPDRGASRSRSTRALVRSLVTGMRGQCRHLGAVHLVARGQACATRPKHVDQPVAHFPRRAERPRMVSIPPHRPPPAQHPIDRPRCPNRHPAGPREPATGRRPPRPSGACGPLHGDVDQPESRRARASSSCTSRFMTNLNRALKGCNTPGRSKPDRSLTVLERAARRGQYTLSASWACRLAAVPRQRYTVASLPLLMGSQTSEIRPRSMKGAMLASRSVLSVDREGLRDEGSPRERPARRTCFRGRSCSCTQRRRPRGRGDHPRRLGAGVRVPLFARTFAQLSLEGGPYLQPPGANDQAKTRVRPLLSADLGVGVLF